MGKAALLSSEFQAKLLPPSLRAWLSTKNNTGQAFHQPDLQHPIVLRLYDS